MNPVKGALVRVDDAMSTLSAIVFQYNPDTLRHSLHSGALPLSAASMGVPSGDSGEGASVPGFPGGLAGAGGIPGTDARTGGGVFGGLGGPASLIGTINSSATQMVVAQAATITEMIRFTLVLDSANAMQDPNQAVASLGLHPVLAALELLLREDSQPTMHATTVFTWGVNRRLPVRLVELDVHELLFDAGLNPLHARVHVTLHAIDGTQAGAGQAAAELLAKHQKMLTSLAQVALTSPVSSVRLTPLTS